MTSIHLSFVPKFFSSFSPLALFPPLIFPHFLLISILHSSPFCAPLKILNLKFTAEFYSARSPPHSKSPLLPSASGFFCLKPQNRFPNYSVLVSTSLNFAVIFRPESSRRERKRQTPGKRSRRFIQLVLRGE